MSEFVQGLSRRLFWDVPANTIYGVPTAASKVAARASS